jgi:hypothetical protein
MTNTEKYESLSLDHKMMIKYTLQRFNFDTVSRTMDALGWTYHDEPYPPKEDELYALASRLCVDCIYEYLQDNSNAEFHITTGGFEVDFYDKTSPDDDSELFLKFVAENTSSDGWNTI